MGLMDKMKGMFGNSGSDSAEHDEVKEYVELDSEASKEQKGKVTVRPFVIEDFADIKAILEVLREGNTIALINIRPLKEKDIVELKRAVNKLKKTTDAIEGDIAGFGEDYVIITPSFAKVYRAKGSPAAQVEQVEAEAEQ
jgi:SepF-like predicted cell division protein (DUF552 family)